MLGSLRSTGAWAMLPRGDCMNRRQREREGEPEVRRGMV